MTVDIKTPRVCWHTGIEGKFGRKKREKNSEKRDLFKRFWLLGGVARIEPSKPEKCCSTCDMFLGLTSLRRQLKRLTSLGHMMH